MSKIIQVGGIIGGNGNGDGNKVERVGEFKKKQFDPTNTPIAGIIVYDIWKNPVMVMPFDQPKLLNPGERAKIEIVIQAPARKPQIFTKEGKKG